MFLGKFQMSSQNIILYTKKKQNQMYMQALFQVVHVLQKLAEKVLRDDHQLYNNKNFC